MCARQCCKLSSSLVVRLMDSLLCAAQCVLRGGRFLVSKHGLVNAEILDPALLRPGRFDTIEYVGIPDAIARRDILCAQTRVIFALLSSCSSK